MLIRKNKLGNYLSIFLYVVIIVVILFILLKFETNVLNANYQNEVKVIKYNLIKDIRNELEYCYGYPFDFNQTVDCDISTNYGGLSIKGFSIVQEEIGLCPEKEWVGANPREYDDLVAFVVAIKNEDLNCLGNLKIFI